MQNKSRYDSYTKKRIKKTTSRPPYLEVLTINKKQKREKWSCAKEKKGRTCSLCCDQTRITKNYDERIKHSKRTKVGVECKAQGSRSLSLSPILSSCLSLRSICVPSTPRASDRRNARARPIPGSGRRLSARKHNVRPHSIPKKTLYKTPADAVQNSITSRALCTVDVHTALCAYRYSPERRYTVVGGGNERDGAIWEEERDRDCVYIDIAYRRTHYMGSAYICTSSTESVSNLFAGGGESAECPMIINT